MQIQPLYLTVGKLLAGRLFKIPEYQRAYTWGNKQRNDLFRDIKNVRAAGSDSMHFMATIVGMRRKTKRRVASDEFDEIEIVDGQQRLTTLTVLLKALAKQMRRGKLRDADEIDSLLVKGDDLALLILQTNHDLTHIFIDYLREGAIPDGKTLLTSADKNIVDAIKECEEFVRTWSDKGKKGLIELYSIIKNRLSIIFFEIEDEGLVYTVFEVLNSRGLDVTWFDKLKSLLMAEVFEGKHRANLHVVSELHKIWTEIYRAIGLRWDSLNKETIRFAGTLRADETPNRPLSEEDAVGRLLAACKGVPKKVIDCSKWVLRVTQAESRLLNDHRLRAASGIVQARLVAVAILLRGFSTADERTILREWENVTFRIYGLGRYDARTRVGDYVRLAWKISNDKLSPKAIIDEIRLLGDGEEFSISSVTRTLFNSNCYGNWSEELRYFFYRYEEHLARKAGQRINEGMWNRIWADEPSKSIEHIYPQSKGSDNPSTGGIYVHRLGNLLMLPPGLNSKLQDSMPNGKAPKYTRQGLLQASEVAGLISKAKWNRASVQKRESRLIRWATEEWG
jgi:hypothetical protein